MLIADFLTVQPNEPNQIAYRGGRVAWSLLEDASRATGRWPKHGWRILRHGNSTGRPATRSVPRTALIVEVKFQSKFVYWMEIECRATESGYLSPVLTNGVRIGCWALKEVVDRLASDEGRRQNSNLKSWARTNLSAVLMSYKHQYEDSSSGQLDLASIVRTFQRVSDTK